MPSSVSIREVGPRDGLQNEDPVPDRRQDRAAGRPVRDRRAPDRGRLVRPSEGDSADGRRRRGVEAGAKHIGGVHYSALVPNSRGAHRALDAGFREIEVVVSASDTHNRKNVNRSTDESLDDIAELIELLHEHGCDSRGHHRDEFRLPVRGRHRSGPGRRDRARGSWPTVPTASRSATRPAWRRRDG